MIGKMLPIPAVDPDNLRQAVFLLDDTIGDESESGAGESDGETLGRFDVHEVLDRIANTLKVDPRMAIALFKRAIALMAFCRDQHLSDTYFEDGVPGRALCAAAARVDVVDLPGDGDGQIGHTLDAAAMQDALKNLDN